MCKTMVFVQEGLQFSLFPGTPKIDPKSDPKAPQMAPKMQKNVIWTTLKKTLENKLPEWIPIDRTNDLFPPQTPLHKRLRPEINNVHRSGALSVITENQFWSHLSASLHPMVNKIMKKWCHKSQHAWKMVPQDLKKSINLWNKINEICLKRYMQLLNFPVISILPICIFSINRTANRETTDCWRGRRQGRSLRITLFFDSEPFWIIWSGQNTKHSCSCH